MFKSFLAAAFVMAPLLALAGPVDINSADAATLARELNGVGQSRAQAIVEYRKTHGRFTTADDLLNVAGIGPQVLNQNRENIQVGRPAPAGK